MNSSVINILYFFTREKIPAHIMQLTDCYYAVNLTAVIDLYRMVIERVVKLTLALAVMVSVVPLNA